MSKKQYYACGTNYDYSIEFLTPDESQDAFFGTIRGPYKTLIEAKKMARYLISTDRDHLQWQLDNINSTRKSDFEGASK